MGQMKKIKHKITVWKVKRNLRALASKWKDLLQKPEKIMENGFPRMRIKPDAEGDLSAQIEAFAIMFKELAYGDRGNFGKKLDSFKESAEILNDFLQAIQNNAEGKVANVEKKYNRNTWSKFKLWVHKHIILRPGTVGWWRLVHHTAKRTREEINKAVNLVMR